MRCGMPRCSPKTATDCWRPKWPKSFWRWWWSKPAGRAGPRTSTSRWTEVCWKLGPARRVFSPRTRRVHRRMIPEIPRWIIAARHARTQRTRRKAIRKRRCARKGASKEAKLSYSGNLLVENRNGLIVDSRVWEATGTAERYAALEMLQDLPGSKRVTVAGDKGFDTADFVRECRNLWVTPHVAQNLGRRGGSAIDSRTARHAGYAISQKKRKRIEECFGWLKTIALLRKVRHRGTLKVDWIFTFACAAYNLGRMRNLMRSVVAR